MNQSIKNILVQGLPILMQFVIVPILAVVLVQAKKFLIAHIGLVNYNKYSLVIKDIVYSVEQQYPEMIGEDKYKAVVYEINEKLGNILSDSEIKTLIESTVAGINLATKGTIKKDIVSTNIENVAEAVVSAI